MTALSIGETLHQRRSPPGPGAVYRESDAISDREHVVAIDSRGRKVIGCDARGDGGDSRLLVHSCADRIEVVLAHVDHR
jgi:hypothetical protein